MILLGITGSVAASLASKIVLELKKYDPQVEVILTKHSHMFLDVESLKEVVDKVYCDADEYVHQWNKNDPILHIDLRNRADKLVIAPASANTIAKLANGMCDNLLTSVFLAWDPQKEVYICPAMNTTMWKKRITQRNIEELDVNNTIIYPQEKVLACGEEGIGALADISEIVQKVALSPYPLDKWWFPLSGCSGIPINPHPGAFGYMRRDKRHTGIDLYCVENTIIRAVEPGKVVSVEHFTGEWDNSPWWNNTDCILVEGESGVVCYGEIHTYLKVGDYVRKGDYVASSRRVIKEGRERPEITGWKPCMLHLELYPKGTYKASSGFDSLLRDPTPFLLESYGRPKETLIYENYIPR